jgi:predicted secreted protein
MPPINATEVVIKVGATDTGPFASIANLTGYTATHSREAETRTRVFAREDAYVKQGDKETSYDLNGLYDTADTEGQNVLRDAYEDETEIYLQVLHDGANGYQQAVQISEYSDSGEADGEYVEVSFTAISAGAKTDVTAA